MTAESSADVRAQILELVGRFERIRAASRPSFVPGESMVRYAGRVFGASELQLATEAVLDFWLTDGRFTELRGGLGVGDEVITEQRDAKRPEKFLGIF